MLRMTGVLCALFVSLFAITAALAQELKLTRTAKSGAETLIAYARSWDGNCNALPSTVIITRPPAGGTVWVTQGTSTIPASTPASGNTGNCAGKSVAGNQVMYKSNPDFRGTDVVSYDVADHNGKKQPTTITVNVQ